MYGTHLKFWRSNKFMSVIKRFPRSVCGSICLFTSVVLYLFLVSAAEIISSIFCVSCFSAAILVLKRAGVWDSRFNNPYFNLKPNPNNPNLNLILVILIWIRVSLVPRRKKLKIGTLQCFYIDQWLS